MLEAREENREVLVELRTLKLRFLFGAKRAGQPALVPSVKLPSISLHL